MAKKSRNLSVDDDLNEIEEETAGEGYGYASEAPEGFSFPYGSYPMPNGFGPVVEDGNESIDDDEENEKPKKKKKPRKRRESDFFYVNRKFPCFMVFLCLFLCVAIVGLSVLGAMPSMKENKVVSMLLEFTALYKKPDMTPSEDREPTTDEEGNEVAYQDKSEYVGFFDILMGTIKNLFGIGTDAEAEPETPLEAETEDGEISEEGAAKEGFSLDTPFYDSIKAETEAKGFTSGLPLSLADYFGLGIALFLVFVLYYMIKAFCALFGRRVFKNFGLGSILALLTGVVVLIGSISVLSIFVSPAGEAVDLQFGAIGDFLTAGFSAPPEFTFIMGEAEEIVALPFVAGYGFYLMLVLPIVALLFSTAARKKLPYSIFD